VVLSGTLAAMEAGGPHSMPRTRIAKFIAVSLLVTPFASVLIWFGILYALDDSNSTPASIASIASITAAVAVPIFLGVRWGIKVLWVIFGAVGGFVMWCIAFAILWRIAIAIDGDSGGYYIGGAILPF
jgi:hypothetical protein